jgi:Alpha/beta hydrolase
MTTMTMTGLLTAKPAAFHRAAIGWAGLAADLDRAYEEYRRGLNRVDSGWPAGAGAKAAAQQLTAQAHELSNVHNPARHIAEALERHAYAIGEIQQHAERIIVGAEQAGYRVDRDTGSVTARVAGIANGADDNRASAWIFGLSSDLSELLWRARRLDEETAAVIRANQPARAGGFGSTVAYHVDRDQVAKQRGRRAADVHAWWQGLSPEQQEQVLRDFPDLIGWLNGLPATDRDRANRSTLDNQLVDLTAREADLSHQLAQIRHAGVTTFPVDLDKARRISQLQHHLIEVRATEAGLRAVQDQLAQFGDHALLMGIDGQGDGRAIVSLGDPDRARHTAVFVPGINTDLLDIGGDLDRVDNLQRAADRMTPQGDDVAVVYWLGYDTPGTLDALSHRAARHGAGDFTPFVDGLRATHELDDSYHVTAVGHSYGTTVIAESALAGGLRADDIVAAGSPGMHTDRAAKLNLDPRHVWGGLADGDLIGGGLGDLGFVHGEEPTDAAFGGNRFEVDTRGHSAYWTENSTSLRNQAYIVVAQYDRVSYDYGAPPTS